MAATTPLGQQHVGRCHRLAQQPAAIAAQVQHDAGRIGAAGLRSALDQRAPDARSVLAAEAGDAQHQQVADPLRVHGFRRHHGAHKLGGARPPSRPRQVERDAWCLRAAIQPATVARICAPQVAGRRPRGCGRPAGCRARPPGRRRPPPHHDAPSAGATRAPAPAAPPTAARDPRRASRGADIARIGVEMVEHLVEEALHEPCVPARRTAPRRPGGGCSSRRRVAPGGRSRSSAGSGSATDGRGPAREHERRPATPVVRSGSSAVSPRSPQTRELRHRHRFQDAGRHEGERRARRRRSTSRGVEAAARRRTVWARRGSDAAAAASRKPTPASPARATACFPACRALPGARRRALQDVEHQAAGDRARLGEPHLDLLRQAEDQAACGGRSGSASVHRASRNRPAGSDTGTIPLAPLAGDCDEKPEPRHAGNARGEIRARLCPPCRQRGNGRSRRARPAAARRSVAVMCSAVSAKRAGLVGRAARRRRAAARRSARDAPADRRSGGSGW